MFRLRALACGVMMLAGAAVLPNARAQDPGDPVVRAQLMFPLPDGGHVMSVEPRDDTDENLRLRDLMVARLRARSDRVVADAPLILRFSVKVVSGLDAPKDSGVGFAGVYAGGRAPPNSISPDTPLLYRMSATLEQRDGPVLWKAEVSARPRGRDDRELRERLAGVLIDNIGKTLDTRRPGGAPANAGR